jgi:hypothetical protein
VICTQEIDNSHHSAPSGSYIQKHLSAVALRKTKGFSFPKSSKGIKFAISQSPGPLFYYADNAEKKLKGMKHVNAKGSNMTHLGSARFIEAVVNENIKDVRSSSDALN